MATSEDRRWPPARTSTWPLTPVPVHEGVDHFELGMSQRGQGNWRQISPFGEIHQIFEQPRHFFGSGRDVISLSGPKRSPTNPVLLSPQRTNRQSLSRKVRRRVTLLLAYLAMPIDLIPDFIPVLGYADDVIVIAAALRSILRTANTETIEAHWRGTPEGLDILRQLTGTRERARQ